MVFSIVYELAIRIIWWMIGFIGWWYRPLFRLWKTRRQPLPEIPDSIRSWKKLYWMHCASLGEYEQGKPVLEELRMKNPEILVMVSFFSASGYRRLRTGVLVDYKCYLPMDTAINARRFIRKYHPDVAIFVKYEFWYNYLRILNQSTIPTFFISVLLDNSHYLLNRMGRPWLNQLKKVDMVFTQDEATEKRLNSRGLANTLVCGDTRVDAVTGLPEISFADETVERFYRSSEKPVIVIGSCWKQDLELIASVEQSFLNKYRWMVAPHQISEEMLVFLEKSFSYAHPVRYTHPVSADNSDFLIIDTIGILKYLYRFADIVFIGGGFGAGIHNTLEPAAYGKPVIFGPKYQKFREAKILVEQGAFFSVSDRVELEKAFTFLAKEANYQKSVTAIKEFMAQNRGATRKIVEKMSELSKFDQ